MPALVDRGWRRSGTFLYKPNLKESCCPAYTIRLDVSKFVPSKRQHKLIRRTWKKLAPPTKKKSPPAASKPTTRVPTLSPEHATKLGEVQRALEAVVRLQCDEHHVEFQPGWVHLTPATRKMRAAGVDVVAHSAFQVSKAVCRRLRCWWTGYLKHGCRRCGRRLELRQPSVRWMWPSPCRLH